MKAVNEKLSSFLHRGIRRMALLTMIQTCTYLFSRN